MDRWKWFHSTGALATIIALPLAAVGLALGHHPLAMWLSSLILMAAFVVLVGHGLTGFYRGVFIDERNVISLSRLQMVVWPLLVLSGFFAAAMLNLAWNHDTPLAIGVPQQLWIMMGISTTALVGSPLLLSPKKDKLANNNELANTQGQINGAQGIAQASTGNIGQLVVNKNIADARWSDMFTGEEVGNAAHVDMTRLQMFFFTLITIIAYGYALGRMFSWLVDAKIGQLPDLDQSMLTLIGISNAGYLTGKGASHSASPTAVVPAIPAKG